MSDHKNAIKIISGIKSTQVLLLEAGKSFEKGHLSEAKSKLNNARATIQGVLSYL